MPVVDVIIPVYQRASLCRQAVDSVLKQSLRELAVYVIEDGIVPGSGENFQTLEGSLTDKRIQHSILSKRRGPSFARNHGASLGMSPYIAFLDSDDLWAEKKLERQVEFLENHNHISWVHTNEIWYKNAEVVRQKREHKKQGGQFLERSMRRCLISPSAVMFRRKFWNEFARFPENFPVAEDFSLWLHLIYSFEIGFLEEPLTIKRAGDWSQLSNTRNIDHYRVLALHKFYREKKKDVRFAPYRIIFFNEIHRKLQILLKGAEKYNNRKTETYRKWLAVFTILRTRAMSLS